MDDEFLNKYFEDLEKEIDNLEYIESLKHEINDIDEDKLENIIKEYF